MKKLISVFVILCFVTMPVAVSGQQFTHLKKGEKAPFAGTLLDDESLARIKAQKELCEDLAQLQVKKECEKDLARLQRNLDQTKVERDTALKEKEIVEKIKDEEIKRLRETIEDSPGDYSSLYFAGGACAGIALSLGMFWLAVQTANSGGE